MVAGMKYKTEYNRDEGAVDISAAMRVPIGLIEFNAVQEVTEGRFLELYLAERISIKYDGRKKRHYVRELYLNGLGLKELRPNISRLRQLRVLELYNNKLKTLPIEVYNLGDLEKLDLRHNDLIGLPEGIEKLKRLQWLWIEHNPELAALPKGLRELSGFFELSIQTIQRNNLDSDSLQVLGDLGNKVT